MRRVLVLGSGKRVQEAALPALAALPHEYEVAGVFARTAKTLEIGERTYVVEPIETLGRDGLAAADLVFMAVAKKAVPEVLARLGALEPGSVDLLIDTPVMLFRHMGHLERLAPFRAVWVAEDCTELACFDPLRAAQAAGELGPVRRVELDRSAYAYHGLATAKALFGQCAVRRGRRRKGREDQRTRRVWFDGGRELTVVEPRDYRVGRVRIEGEGWVLSDAPELEAGVLRLAPVLESGECVGFAAGERTARLASAERALIGAPLEGAEEPFGVTAWMEGMKRVGFLRLLERIAAGSGAYPLVEAVDDTVVDYHLERLGVYFANPLTHPGHAPARALLRLAGRLTGAGGLDAG